MRRSTTLFVLSYPAAIILAPVLLVAGDPLLNWARRRTRVRRVSVSPDGRLSVSQSGTPLLLAHNPLVIALTAPSRWAAGQLGRPRRPTAARWSGPDLPPRPDVTGVREPRRPKPTYPSDAIALREPIVEPRQPGATDSR
jgi:hypothetical protein